MVKNLPVLQETGTGFLDWEDPLEKGMAVHSSILAWRKNSMGRGAWWATYPMGQKESDLTERLILCFHSSNGYYWSQLLW